MTDYIDYQVASAPTWMQRAWGIAWNAVLGVAKDAFVAGAKVAVKARFAAVAPDDALPHLLRDFVLDALAEPASATRARLARAWEQWLLAGTVAGVVAALNDAGYGTVLVHERVTGARWWEFAVTLRPPFPWDHAGRPLLRYGTAWAWGTGFRWFELAPVGERERVIAIIRKWKPAHARLLQVVVQVEGPYWGEFTWGDGTTYGGTADYWS